MKKSNVKSASAIGDNGRRGEPLPGCDCVQCFGYCLQIDSMETDGSVGIYTDEPYVEERDA